MCIRDRAHRGSVAVLQIHQAHTVNIGVNDVAGLINKGRIEVEYLIKTAAEDFPHIQSGHEHNGRYDAGQLSLIHISPSLCNFHKRYGRRKIAYCNTLFPF